MVPQLTGKDHSKVMSDIKRVLEEVGIDRLRFESIFLDSYKREQVCFNLPRLECDLVVSGYSATYRLAIIKRWLVVPQPQITGKPTPTTMFNRYQAYSLRNRNRWAEISVGLFIRIKTKV